MLNRLPVLTAMVVLPLVACKKEAAPPETKANGCPALLEAIDKTQADLEKLGRASPDANPESAAELPRKTSAIIASLSQSVGQLDRTDPTIDELAGGIDMLSTRALTALGDLDVEGKRLAEVQTSLTAIETKGNDALEAAKGALVALDESCAAATRPACKAAREGIAAADRPVPAAFDTQTAKDGAAEIAKRFESIARSMDESTGDDDARKTVSKSAAEGAAAYRELAKRMDELGTTLEKAAAAQRSTEESLSRLDAELRAAEDRCKPGESRD